MKVLYDYQIFDMQQFGGISRYFSEIISRVHSEEYILPIHFTDNHYLKDVFFSIPSNQHSYSTFLPNLKFRGKKRLFQIRNTLCGYNVESNETFSERCLLSGDYSVFHPTYYNPYFLEFIGNKPFVLTVHDMIHEKYPEFFGLQDTTQRNKELLVKKASKIIAISECTKKDILDTYPIDEYKIEVIYHGSSLPKSEDSSIVNPYGRYFLFTGTRSGYKNFYFMFNALVPILAKNPDIALICTGQPFSSCEIQLFNESGIRNQIIHIFVDDTKLLSLYKNAIAFIFPSYYEGFGIPILEAFEAETPVILSRASCFTEIAGDAALYFEPKNQNELRDACTTLLNSDTERKKLIALGTNRLAEFSWEKTVSQTKRLYESI